MGKAERAKGAEAEREVARILTAAGFPASRNARNGLSAEDVSHQIPGVWLEVKRRERLNVSEAMNQARAGAAAGQVPMIVHRRSREPWLVTLPLTDLLKMMEATSQ
jgi:Holliday junction resolvase